MGALLVLSLFCAGPVVGEIPFTLTLDVINPAQARVRILHLEDVVGPKVATGSSKGRTRKRAVLLFSVALEDCGREVGLCSTMEKYAVEADRKDGLIVAVLVEQHQRAERARREIPSAGHGFPIALDAHGILRRVLEFDRPRQMVMFDSSGRMIRLGQISEGEDAPLQLEDALGKFFDAIRGDKEDEG